MVRVSLCLRSYYTRHAKECQLVLCRDVDERWRYRGKMEKVHSPCGLCGECKVRHMLT